MKNIWRLKKCPYLCSPFEKQRYLKRHKKFIEKIEGKYKKQVPRKNTIYREALIPYGIISVRTDWKYKNIYTMKSLILAQDER